MGVAVDPAAGGPSPSPEAVSGDSSLISDLIVAADF